MSVFLHSFGMGVLEEDKDSLMNIVGYAIHEGKPITGYYGLPYINHHYGDLQMIARTRKTEDGQLEVTGFDTHCKGLSVWELRIEEELKNDKDDPLSKRLLCTGKDGNGMLVTEVVNADVLPSFQKGQVLKLQMAAYTNHLSFFEDEEAYEETVEPGKDGKKLLAGVNTIIPTGLFADTEDPALKDLVMIHGTVKGFQVGKLDMGQEDGEKLKTFLYCCVDTPYGDLEIVVSMDSIEDDMIPHMKQGCVAHCAAWLCGDAAIYEYDHGIVKNAENNLKLCAYILSGGDPERYRPVLAEHFVYHSETSGKHIEDADELIDFIRLVRQEGDPCTVYDAIISNHTGDEAPEYADGTSCLALKYGDEEDYDCLVFVDTDEEGNITRILLSRDSRYRFIADEDSDEQE